MTHRSTGNAVQLGFALALLTLAAGLREEFNGLPITPQQVAL